MTSPAVPVGYGIDFGTSNSSVSIAYADRVEVLHLGRQRSSATIPSFVYLHRAGGRAAGDEALKTFLKWVTKRLIAGTAHWRRTDGIRIAASIAGAAAAMTRASSRA